jgi:serine/threonine-protein kinase HipA
MYRAALVYMHNVLAGQLQETESGYSFKYNDEYRQSQHTIAISKTLPKEQQVYNSKVLFPFFDGLIPEGWLLNLAAQNWKLNQKDRFGLLLACCKNCIGAVSIVATQHEEL